LRVSKLNVGIGSDVAAARRSGPVNEVSSGGCSVKASVMAGTAGAAGVKVVVDVDATAAVASGACWLRLKFE